MRPAIHLFFNGEGCVIPPHAAWEKFEELDSLRTFAICAESWRRHGWEVHRLSTLGGTAPYDPRPLKPDFIETPFSKTGECSKSFHWYPAHFWQFIAKAKTVAAPGELTLFGTIDVINFGFKPADFGMAAASQLGVSPFEQWNGSGCINLQMEHGSLACFAATREWLEEAEKILLRYDAGELAPLRRDYTSDETILRNYAKFDQLPKLIMAANTERGSFPLLHFARSTMRPLWRDVPLSQAAATVTG